MELIQDAVDYGDAPCIFVSDICRYYLISPNVLRIVFVKRDIAPDEKARHLVSGHLDLDVAEAPALIGKMRQILDGLPRKLAVIMPGYTPRKSAAN